MAKEITWRNVCVIGLGYIGLPTASLLATRGYTVHGVDVNRDTVETINQGRIHIVEPDLDILVRSAVQSGQLTAGMEATPADVFILAVPTPFKGGNEPDLSYVEAATRDMTQVLQAGNLVILESTSPVGTTEKVAEWIAEERPDLAGGSVHVAHCPERVLPGQIIKELVDNDRVVGGLNKTATEAAIAFYEEFVSGAVLATTARTAEMAKLTENTFRDVNIALANELSMICDRLGIDVWRLIELANRHPRVNVLRPGPGVGGHCIAVDPWFVIASAPDDGHLIRAARSVNDAKPGWVVSQVIERSGRLRQPVVACLGLAYKPDVDDLRESPAVRITGEIGRAGIGEVLAVEPHCDELPPELNEAGVMAASLGEAIERADLIVALVPHRPFLQISASQLTKKMIVDACGLLRLL